MVDVLVAHFGKGPVYSFVTFLAPVISLIFEIVDSLRSKFNYVTCYNEIHLNYS